MKKTLLLFFILAGILSEPLTAHCCFPCDPSFYLKLGTGISFSESAQIKAPPAVWNRAIQGYNSKLGNRAIADFGIGCEFMQLVDVELSISARSTFKYRKFQTPVDGGDSYKREFDLDVIPVLFTVKLLGKQIPCLNWDFACGKIYPIAALGVGVSNLWITNFRTTGLAPSGTSDPWPSFSAENQYTHHKKFTCTALIGFEYNYCDCWALSTGYRFFDAGRFKGPRFQRVASGAAVDVSGEEWKMRFRANEWFIELKIFL